MVAQSIPDLLARAATLGEQIERIEGNVALQRLSRASWIGKCLELGGLESEAELQADLAKLPTVPYLEREVAMVARRWEEQRLDRPSVWSGFSQVGDHTAAAAYTERLTLGWSGERCSAMAAYVCASQAGEAFFGRLGDFGERQALLDPLVAELRALDGQIAERLLVRDLHWLPDGKIGMLLPAGRTMIIARENADRLASATAAFVQFQMKTAA